MFGQIVFITFSSKSLSLLLPMAIDTLEQYDDLKSILFGARNPTLALNDSFFVVLKE